MALLPFIKKVVKPCIPQPILRRLRTGMAPTPPAIRSEGIQEIDCLGLRWRLDMASSISRSLVRTGIWEPDTTKLVLDFTKPGMQVLSVGANFGYYALLM